MSDEYYVPGLGIVTTYDSRSITVECTEDELLAVGTPIEHMEFCGGCDKADQNRLVGDYICVECRELQGDITYTADLREFTEKENLNRNPDQLGLDVSASLRDGAS